MTMTEDALALACQRLAQEAPGTLRRGFALVGTSRVRDGWDIVLRGSGVDLRLELTPVAGNPEAMVRVDFRRSPTGPAAPILGPLGRWTPLITETLPTAPDRTEAAALLARVRSRLVGDPRSERLLRR